MSAIADKFSELKARNEKALVLFVTAGDPPLDQLPAILGALVEGGADLIEIGMPFSDPIADGPVIQEASQRALDSGVTPEKVFTLLETLPVDIPRIMMGYTNTVLRPGLAHAAKRIAAAKFSGAIISDLTPEESSEWVEACRVASLDPIFLAAPTSTDERLDEAIRRSQGFVYVVARTGVTGENSQAQGDAFPLLERLRARTSLPLCVGFGVSSPEQVRKLAQKSDGVIVGSWLVELLRKEWRWGAGRRKIIEAVTDLKAGTRTG